MGVIKSQRPGPSENKLCGHIRATPINKIEIEMTTSTDRSVDLNLSSSNWSSVDIDDETIEMELAVGASPPLAEIEEDEEEEEEDLLDYDDDDDDSMISGDYTEDETMSPEMTRRPISIYSSTSRGIENMNMLGLSELSDVGDNEEFDTTEDEEEEEVREELTKCCGQGTVRKIKGALIGFAKATITVIYKVYAMMTPKQKMVIAGAATAAVMSMVGIEKDVATESVDDDEVDVADEGEDEMTTTDVVKDVASDLINVIIDNIEEK
jgi:hypothetical protein